MPAGSEEALDMSTFFEVSLDLLVIRELDGRVVRVSPSWEAILGWRPEEMEGRPLLSHRQTQRAPCGCGI